MNGCRWQRSLRSGAFIELYSTVMCTHSSVEHTHFTRMMDNEALDIELNRSLKQVISLTASPRFYGALNVSVAEFQTNLVPCPRSHMLLCSYAPSSQRRGLAMHSCRWQRSPDADRARDVQRARVVCGAPGRKHVPHIMCVMSPPGTWRSSREVHDADPARDVQLAHQAPSATRWLISSCTA